MDNLVEVIASVRQFYNGRMFNVGERMKVTESDADDLAGIKMIERIVKKDISLPVKGTEIKPMGTKPIPQGVILPDTEQSEIQVAEVPKVIEDVTKEETAEDSSGVPKKGKYKTRDLKPEG